MNLKDQRSFSEIKDTLIKDHRGGGDPAFWEEPASWEGTCILGGNYFF